MKDAIIRFADGVSFRKMGKHGIILHTRSGMSYKCNATAAEVLSCIDGKRSGGDIIKLVSRNYDEFPQVIQNEIQSLIASLETKGLLDRLAGVAT